MSKSNPVTDIEHLPGSRPARLPEKMAPMLATPVPRPFSDPDWIFEPKLDGFRGIAFIKQNGNAKVLSRRGADLTHYFKPLATSLESLNRETVLDGEIVALAPDSKPCFECLQQHIGMRTEGPKGKVPWPYAIMYFAFDVVYLDGYDLAGVSLMDRKKVLAGFVSNTGPMQMVGYFEKDGELLFEKAVEQGFEGIVAKRKDSVYEPGKRTDTWLKAKASINGEFIVGGYVVSERTNMLGGLVLGQYENGKFVYKGNVGTGISKQERAELELRLAEMKVDQTAFDEKIGVDGQPVWVKPEVAVNVQFTSWTHGGYMREPVFVRVVDR
jgi:bifunctional non-homologous end joining protein LigD